MSRAYVAISTVGSAGDAATQAASDDDAEPDRFELAFETSVMVWKWVLTHMRAPSPSPWTGREPTAIAYAGISVHHLTHTLVDLVYAAGLNKRASMYELDPTVIRAASAGVLSPGSALCPGGCAYVHTLQGADEVGVGTTHPAESIEALLSRPARTCRTAQHETCPIAVADCPC